VRALVSTLPADYCTVIAPEERLTHAEMLHELRESGRAEDTAIARWSLAAEHTQERASTWCTLPLPLPLTPPPPPPPPPTPPPPPPPPHPSPPPHNPEPPKP